MAAVRLLTRDGDPPIRPEDQPCYPQRPIRGPLRDVLLAFCDATSVAFTDFVPSDLVYRDRAGET
jgi:hypothetical protein